MKWVPAGIVDSGHTASAPAGLKPENRGQRFDAAGHDVGRRGREAEADVVRVGAEARSRRHEEAALDTVLQEAAETPLVQPAGDIEEEEGAPLRRLEAEACRGLLAGLTVALPRLRHPVPPRSAQDA